MEDTHFIAAARHHRIRLIIWLIVSLVLFVVMVEVFTWAEPQRRLQPQIVALIAIAICGATGFSVVFLGYSLYLWFSHFKIARNDAKHYNVEYMKRLHSDVIGPIWGGRRKI